MLLKTFQVNNPATGEVLANVSCKGGKETNDAISSAYHAFPSWSKLTASERSKFLRKWFDLLVSHKEELGQLITLEQGKPLKEAIGEVTYGANFIEFYAEEAKRIYGDIIPAPLADRRLFVLKQPVGVVGAVTPWNFPLAMITRKVLELFQVLAKSDPIRLSAADIVDKLGIQNTQEIAMIDRILRLLGSYSVVTCSLGDSKVRVYGLASVTKYFIRNEDGVSLGPLMSLSQDSLIIDSWHKLKDAVVEGGVPFYKVHGLDGFELAGKDQRFNMVLNEGMHNHTTVVMKKILEVYKGFENLEKVVDVGGGLGVTLSIITTKYPSIKGIGFDLPHVIKDAPPVSGVEYVGGDMFDCVPAGDAIFMKWILHDWSDGHCIKLLKNCYKALPDNGKVIVVEFTLPEVPETSAATKAVGQMDVLLITQNPGAKEKTKNEFLNLALEAGFAGIRFECLACNFWVMEFYK